MCAIDVSKALDKMNHYGLFIKLNPNSQRKTELNWNELNWTRSFSSGCTLVNRPATFGRVECCPLIYLPYTELNRMMNWTGSFSSVRLSSVQFSAVHWTGDDRRRPSLPVFVQRHTLHWLADSRVCPACEKPATTANFVAESSQVVVDSMHSGKLNWTAELSFQLCTGLDSHHHVHRSDRNTNSHLFIDPILLLLFINLKN